MLLSIHQASYFPWLGLLDKINKSDVYMVMDDVQLSDKAYQHRNIFLTADGKVKFLTIPFIKKDYLKRRYREIEIAQQDWRSNHTNFIWNTYRKHPFASEILPRLESYYSTEHGLLSSAVLASMRLSFELFGIATRVILQSEMEYDESLRAGELVYALARAAGADCYLSGTGARAYLDESVFGDAMTLRYNEFVHPVYAQKGCAEFHPNLSCLDALFNLGIDGARKLLAGARQ
jgi:WbqC-like protein family